MRFPTSIHLLSRPRPPHAQAPVISIGRAGSAAPLVQRETSCRTLNLATRRGASESAATPPAGDARPRPPRPTLKRQRADIRQLRAEVIEQRAELRAAGAKLDRMARDLKHAKAAAQYSTMELLRVTDRLHPLGVLQFVEERYSREMDPDWEEPTVIIPVSAETARELRQSRSSGCGERCEVDEN